MAVGAARDAVLARAASARERTAAGSASRCTPAYIVYNPATLLRLRDEVGDGVGCNFDPTHLFWQGIDPLEAIQRARPRGAIFHVHAKDTRDRRARTCAVNGVLDTKRYGRACRPLVARSARSATGTARTFWLRLLSALRMAGYDDVISIEHEDGLMSMDEGLAKAVRLLDQEILKERPPLRSA